MIGNDIVFLDQSRAPNRVKKYLHKISSIQERNTLEALEKKLRMPFAWSIKEASYKYCRQHSKISFKPKAFKLQNITTIAGTKCIQSKEVRNKGFENIEHKESIIETSQYTLVCKSIITEHYIHSVLSKSRDLLDQVFWGVSKIDTTDYQRQSTEVRRKAIDHLLTIENRVGSIFRFGKRENNAPMLWVNNKNHNSNFSFSHDHNYVAYAWFTQ